jgi:hypothetical protein
MFADLGSSLLSDLSGEFTTTLFNRQMMSLPRYPAGQYPNLWLGR